MKKDSYWFRHDSTAGRGLKLRKIQHLYGHWGKGIYWDVIETLRDQEGYKYPSDSSSLQMLCDLIGCKDEAKFFNWYKDCIKNELFSEHEEFFYSEVLILHMAKWESAKNAGIQSSIIKSQRNVNGSANEQVNGTSTEAPTKLQRTGQRNVNIIGEEKRGEEREDTLALGLKEKKEKASKEKKEGISFPIDDISFKNLLFKQIVPRAAAEHYWKLGINLSNQGKLKLDWISYLNYLYSQDIQSKKVNFSSNEPLFTIK